MSQGSWLNGGGERSGSGARSAFPAIQNPTRDEIVRITLSPLFLLLPPASHLAIRIPTSSLTQANSWIRPEPTPANAAAFTCFAWRRSGWLLERPKKEKGGSKSFLPWLTDSQMKLVANRTRNWGSVPHAGASIVTYPDGRSTVRDELQHASLVIAKGAHARRLIRGWRGVHFEPVVDDAH